MPKRLVKSTNKKLWGVAGGVAEYFNVDPILVRVGFVVLCFICFIAAIVGYVALAWLMPSPTAVQPHSRTGVVDSPDQDVR